MNSTNQNPNSKRTKTILFIVLGLVVLCVFICAAGVFAARKYASNIVYLDAGKARTSAHLITDYDLPEGFHEVMGFKFFGADLTTITNSSQTNIIWLVQNPWSGFDDLRSSLERISKDVYTDDPVSWKKVGERGFVLRGKETVVDIFSGESQNGEDYLAWVGAFPGKKGDAMVGFIAPEDEWDEAIVVKFLKSLR